MIYQVNIAVYANSFIEVEGEPIQVLNTDGFFLFKVGSKWKVGHVTGSKFLGHTSRKKAIEEATSVILSRPHGMDSFLEEAKEIEQRKNLDNFLLIPLNEFEKYKKHL